MSVLEKKLTELIAKDLGVAPEQITTEFIHAWREEYLYPKATYNFTSRYGGYNSSARRALSGSQLQERREIAESFWEQFSKSERR